MVKIAVYHAELAVQKKDGSVVVLKADLEDYATDREVLEALNVPFGVSTVGELVEWLEDEGLTGVTDGGTASVEKEKGIPVLSVRIEGGDERCQLRYLWDDPI